MMLLPQLLLLLLPLLRSALPGAAALRPVDGLPVLGKEDQKKLETSGRLDIFLGNYSSFGGKDCDHGWRSGVEAEFNKHRLCPVRYTALPSGSSTGFPVARVSATCGCPHRRGDHDSNFKCVRVRLPVTELQPADAAVPGGRQQLVESTVLRPVDCAILEEQIHAKRVVITGKELRLLGSTVGQPIFRNFNCDEGARSPITTFGLRMDPAMVPTFQPIARCPCNGQAVTMLPMSVLKQVGNGSNAKLRSDFEIVEVGCAIPDNT